MILQEEPDGYRTLNDAKRISRDGRVEQLGWPRAEISYRPGTRHPESARLHLTDPAGAPLTVELETVTSVPLHVGAGYGGDPDWTHGQWMGPDWARSAVYDLTDPAVAARIPFGVTDHLARARLGDEPGWGLFEHASMGQARPNRIRRLVLRGRLTDIIGRSTNRHEYSQWGRVSWARRRMKKRSRLQKLTRNQLSGGGRWCGWAAWQRLSSLAS